MKNRSEVSLTVSKTFASFSLVFLVHPSVNEQPVIFVVIICPVIVYSRHTARADTLGNGKFFPPPKKKKL